MADKLLFERLLSNYKVKFQTLYNDVIDLKYDNIVLPDITNEELKKRYEKIKPLVNIDNKFYLLRNFSIFELSNESYMWCLDKNIIKCVDQKKIEEVGKFACYHIYGFYGLFNPTVKEILSQMPDDLLQKANAFYLSDCPLTYEDSSSDPHFAKCRKSYVKALVLKK